MQNKRPTNNVHQYYPKSYKHVVDLALVFPQTLAKRSSKKRSFLLHMVYFFFNVAYCSSLLCLYFVISM